jgi:tetratricopeptide (TPR) repeat protein
MGWTRKILVFAASMLIVFVAVAQHPAREKIDSLKRVLPSTQGNARIDCLNALSEEYWWPPRVWPDSIIMWAKQANDESAGSGYTFGSATSSMHLGVAEIYLKNFLTAEKYLRQSLRVFQNIRDARGEAWCNLWLGQTLYSENDFGGAIAFFRTSIAILTRMDDKEGEGKAFAWMGFLYAATGEYDSSFEYCSKSLVIRQNMSDHVCVAAALTNMGHLYKSAGDFDDALSYYRQGMDYAKEHNINYYAANWNYFDEPIGAIYQLLNNPDSSLYYLQKAIRIDPANQITRISFGETLLLKGEYDSAYNIFIKPIPHFKQENDQWDLMRVLLDVAKAAKGKLSETAALEYAREGYSIAQKANVKSYMVEGLLLLSEVYKKLQKNDSAYFFIKQYMSLKDSVDNRRSLWRLANYKEQNELKKQFEQVSLLEKDNNIKEEKLKNASLIKWVLIIGLLVIGMSGIIAYRSLTLKRKNEKLKSEKEQAILKQTAAELEMQALRAQMNPHFIFNCLSSINRFILINETEAASDYLTKFSRLIRMVLNNSIKTFITLDEELDMFKLYLDMERLRFKDSFDYKITFINSIDDSNVFVPPLLLQPFAENAIWHGLMHKAGKGHLEITLATENKILTCIITDNGIGRKQSALLKSKSAEKQKSLGLDITTKRLALLNNNLNEQSYFEFEDIVDGEGNLAGTRVILKLQYRELIDVSN